MATASAPPADAQLSTASGNVACRGITRWHNDVERDDVHPRGHEDCGTCRHWVSAVAEHGWLCTEPTAHWVHARVEPTSFVVDACNNNGNVTTGGRPRARYMATIPTWMFGGLEKSAATNQT